MKTYLDLTLFIYIYIYIYDLTLLITFHMILPAHFYISVIHIVWLIYYGDTLVLKYLLLFISHFISFV